MKKFFLNIFFLTLGLFASLIAIPAFAQTHITIATSVPGNYGAAAAGASPGAYIANFYIFALIIGGILAFGVVVYGGVKYMASAGNPSGQSDAKEWIEAALLGLLLLVGVYFILDVINPQLLNLNLPTLTAVNIVAPSSGGGGGGGGGSSGNPSARCTAPASGPCSVANLQTTCMGSNAAMAGGVCNTESSGNADGLPAGDGAFLACSFWLCDVYCLQGRQQEAEKLFETLVKFTNDLGLLSEEYDVQNTRLVGNFPQAFSHFALVNTAHNLSQRNGPTQQRTCSET